MKMIQIEVGGGFLKSNISILGRIPTEGYTSNVKQNEMLLLTHPNLPRWQGQQLFRAGDVCSVLGAHQVALMSYQHPETSAQSAWECCNASWRLF